jgi:hypothetical protein
VNLNPIKWVRLNLRRRETEALLKQAEHEIFYQVRAGYPENALALLRYWNGVFEDKFGPGWSDQVPGPDIFEQAGVR